MTWFYIQTEDEFFEHLPNLLAYYDAYDPSVICLDFETYSLTGHFPEPITYYGADKEQLEADAFKRTGLKLLAQDEGHVALMQIGLDPLMGHDEQYIFDIRRLGYEIITKYLKEFIEGSTVVGHVLRYEARYLIKQFGIWPNVMRDSQLLGREIHAGDEYKHTLYGEYKKFLDSGWFRAETGMSFSEYAKFKEDNQKSDWTLPELSQDQLDYAADDVRLPMFLYAKQKEALVNLIKKKNRPGLMDIVRLDNNLINEFALIKTRGVPFDAAYHQVEVIDYLEQKLEEATEGVGKYFTVEVEDRIPYEHLCKNGNVVTRYHKPLIIKPINMKSVPQVRKALEDAGIKLPLDKKTGKPSTGATALKKVRHEHPAIEHMLKSKKAGHLLDNYGQCMLDMIHSDGRLHANFSIVGARTGRSSSSEPNLQKIPNHEKLFGERPAGPMFRTAYTVPLGPYAFDEEWIWISCDLSQIEPHMIAQLTGDETLCAELNDPDGDVHGLFGQALMGLNYKPGRATYERKTVGKTGGLSVFYNTGAKTLAEFMYDKTIDEETPIIWTKDEAQDKINSVWEMFPQVKQAIERVARMVENAMEPYNSLSDFIYRKPIFEIFTKGTVKDKGYTRYEKWCLAEHQEGIARKVKSGELKEDPLHRNYVVRKEVEILDENGKPTGRTRVIESRWNEWAKTKSSIIREAWNFLFQGACGDLFKIAVLNTSRELRDIPGLDPIREGIVSVVHDEVNLVVRKQFAEQVKEIVARNMVDAGKLFIDKVPVKIEIGMGRGWAETH